MFCINVPFPLRCLLKQVGVRACPDQAEFTAINPVYEQPVGFNVTFSTILEQAFELMISLLCFQFFGANKGKNDPF